MGCLTIEVVILVNILEMGLGIKVSLLFTPTGQQHWATLLHMDGRHADTDLFNLEIANQVLNTWQYN